MITFHVQVLSQLFVSICQIDMNVTSFQIKKRAHQEARSYLMSELTPDSNPNTHFLTPAWLATCHGCDKTLQT